MVVALAPVAGLMFPWEGEKGKKLWERWRPCKIEIKETKGTREEQKRKGKPDGGPKT